MQITPGLLSETIGEIYGGVGAPDGFDAALRSMRTLFGASRATLLMRLHDRSCLFYEVRPQARGDLDGADASRESFACTPNCSSHANQMAEICSGCSTTARRLCCCVDAPGDLDVLPGIHLSLHRGTDSPPFAASEREALKLLGSHVLRALRLAQRIEVAETAYSTGNRVLEEVRRGVVVLNQRKEVVFMNRQAEGLCTSARGVTSARQASGGRTLRASAAGDDCALQRAIDGALQQDAAAARRYSYAEAVRIGNRQTGQATLFRVVPLPPNRQSALGSERHALLFIDDLTARESGDDRLLTAVFGLTRAEVRVARALLAGARPKAIAQQLAVSEETIRTQLKAVYAKTETRGIASLVALLSRLADAPLTDLCESAAEPTYPMTEPSTATTLRPSIA